MISMDDRPTTDSCEFEPALIADARALISRHVHFRGRIDHFTFEVEDDALVVAGTVPSFYLKQLLQTVLRELHSASRIVNHVEVVSSRGVSSCSCWRRELCSLEYKWLGKVPHCFPTCDDIPGAFAGERSPR